MNKIKFLPTIALPLFLLISYLTIPSSCGDDGMGSIAVTLTYTNGDTADYWPVSLKLYQDSSIVSYKEIDSLSANPFNIVSLPIGHKYKIEAFANNMYSSTEYVDLQKSHQDVNIKLPLPGGMRIDVFYNDGLTPIHNATVYVQSKENKTWSHGFTDDGGKTMRFWLEPTVDKNDFYKVNIKIGNNLTYLESPVFLRPGIPQEIKILTPWPPLINSLVTVNVRDSHMRNVSPSQGQFSVILYNAEGVKIGESPVTHRGEAYFSNLKVGEYLLQAIRTNNSSQWGVSKIVLDGSKSSFIISENLQPEVISAAPQPPISGNQTLPLPQNTSLSESSTNSTPNQIVQSLKTPTIVNCNCVAFRLDNVQDYWLDDVQLEIINIFERNNASLTAGIIGGAFGTDSKLTEAIKSKAANELIDIGINGWNFEDFSTLGRSEQYQLLQESKNKITTQLGIIPSVFIPPYGKSNNDTFFAMNDNGITYLSGNLITSIPQSLAKNIHVYPPTVITGGAQNPVSGKTVYNDMILSGIKKSIEINGYAVVTIGFQDYAQTNGTFSMNVPDKEKIQNLQILIEQIKSDGYKIVKIKDISNTTNVPEFGFTASICLMLSTILLLIVWSRSKIRRNF